MLGRYDTLRALRGHFSPHFVAVRPDVVLSEAVADGLPQSLQFPLVTATIGHQFDHSGAHLLPFEFVM